jgi:hypothetical protein
MIGFYREGGAIFDFPVRANELDMQGKLKDSLVPCPAFHVVDMIA